MLEGWGRVPAEGREILSENLERVTPGTVLMRGLGRSYGDSSLPANPKDKVVASRLANRIISFDPETGVLRGEAGLSLVELNRIFLPRNWFTPVTPGTKYVTLGGMVASDVHGKNHHVEGCFGEHVRSIKMRLADDSIVECGPDKESELFWATVGGMGLTGHVLEVEFTMKRIPSPWIWRESTRVRDLAEYMDSLNAAAPRWPMTVGWIDCVCKGSAMGRGILDAGRWATAEEAGSRPLKQGPSIKFPIDLPDWCVNGFTVAAFNTAYYWKQFDERITGLATPKQFFYQLDGILEWKRGYGKRGFTQYQCVIPRAAGVKGVTDFMQLLTKLGGGSPLSVIKDCGPEGRGMLSFPLEGTSIAVDLVVTPELQGIVDRLNEFMIELGGRVYLTKDRFTRAEHFRAMEPRLDAFLAVREKYDPKHRLRSGQSVRLFGDKASAFGAK